MQNHEELYGREPNLMAGEKKGQEKKNDVKQHQGETE